MSTLASLITLTREYIKIDPNARVFSDTTLTNFISRAYFQLQKDGSHRWRECVADTNIATVAGQQDYALPADFLKADLVRYNNQWLSTTDKRKINIIQGNNTTGTPNAYYIYGANLGMYPTPNTTGTIAFSYFKRLPTITASVDSLFPVDFDDGIALYASYIAFKSVNKMDMAAASLSDYGAVLGTLLASYIYDDTSVWFSYQRAGGTASETSSSNLYR